MGDNHSSLCCRPAQRDHGVNASKTSEKEDNFIILCIAIKVIKKRNENNGSVDKSHSPKLKINTKHV